MTKTQNISRANAKLIYDVVCEGWQSRIKDIIMWQSGETIEVDTNIIMQGYDQADAKQKKVLEKYFKIEKAPEILNVKNYAELCKITGTKELSLSDFKQFDNPEQMLAFHQIKTIERIYNQGWKADYSDNTQQKWYPYFVNERGSWLFHGAVGYYDYCGFVGLFKTRQIAEFVGRTFMDIYLKVIY